VSALCSSLPPLNCTVLNALRNVVYCVVYDATRASTDYEKITERRLLLISEKYVADNSKLHFGHVLQILP